MTKIKYHIIVILFLVLTTAIFPATIKGIVQNTRTLEAIGGVEIRIIDLLKYTVSNEKGRFIIEDVEAGVYEVEANMSGYYWEIDTLCIPSADSVIEITLKMSARFLLLEDVLTQEIKDYHSRIESKNEKTPALELILDSLVIVNNSAYVSIIMENKTTEVIYVFKSYLCFNMLHPIIVDMEGHQIKSNLVLIDCMSEKRCPDTADLIAIYPGETIRYPKTKLMFYDFGHIPEGKYRIKVEYRFDEPKRINTLTCSRESNIQAMLIGIRGRYFTSNEVVFNNIHK